MPSEAQVKVRFRFGEFDFDPAASELRRRDGRGVGLDPLPTRLLVLLLERAPGAATREEIRRALWPDKEFGDFAGSINAAVYQVRTALADDSRRPRYIETLRGGGYRMSCAVERDGAEAAPLAAPPAPPAAAAGRGWRSAVAAAGAVVALGAAVVYSTWPADLSPADAALAAMRPITHDGAVKIPPLIISADSVYFTESVGNRLRVARVAAGGGETTEVADGLEGQVLTAVSPDGTRLLVRGGGAIFNQESEAPLYVVPASGGTALPVGGVRSGAAVFTPDGRGIVLARGNGLWECDPQGRGLRQLAATPGMPAAMVWSPHGRRLRFVVFDPRVSTAAIWEWDRDDGSARELAPVPRVESFGGSAWSGGRTMFAFSSDDNETTATGYPGRRWPPWGRRLRLAGLGQADWAGFSPDGEHMYLLRPNGNMGVLLRYDAGRARFEPFPFPAGASELDYSPDGRSVAYIDVPDRTLWRARRDGSAAQQLTAPPMSAGLPRWSADGRWIAFYAQLPGRASRIYRIAAAGGTAVPLDSATLAGGEGAPTWTPDGRMIVFGTVSCARAQGCGIYRADVATGALAMIPGSQGLRTARLSPDGRSIVAIDQMDFAVKRFDLGGSGWRTIATGVVGDGLAWSRDGRYVFAENDRGLKPCIEKIDAARGGGGCYANLSGYLPRSSLGLDWFGLGADGAPMFSVPSPQKEIFELDWPGK